MVRMTLNYSTPYTAYGCDWNLRSRTSDFETATSELEFTIWWPGEVCIFANNTHFPRWRANTCSLTITGFGACYHNKGTGLLTQILHQNATPKVTVLQGTVERICIWASRKLNPSCHACSCETFSMSPKPPEPQLLYLQNRCIHTNVRELQKLVNENMDAFWHGGVAQSIGVHGVNVAPHIN